jgi:hypothetical protein
VLLQIAKPSVVMLYIQLATVWRCGCCGDRTAARVKKICSHLWTADMIVYTINW